MRQQPWWQKKRLILSSLTGSVAVVICLIRFLGGFEGIELSIYDRMWSRKAIAKWDERVVVVGFDDDDVEKYGFYPTDRILTEVLQKVERGNPTTVGLFFTRRAAPYNVDDRENLNKQMNSMSSMLIRASNQDLYPPEPDKVRRKTQLYREKTETEALNNNDAKLKINPSSQHNELSKERNFDWEVAYHYLTNKGAKISENKKTSSITITDPKGDTLRISPLSFLKDGGYSETAKNLRNFQVLTSWIQESPKDFELYSFETILNNSPIDFTDKIVLIGVAAKSHKEVSQVPVYQQKEVYTERYNIEITGIIISNLLNQKRTPFVRVWSDELEYLYFFLWMLLSLILVNFLGQELNGWLKFFAKTIGVLVLANLGIFIITFQVFPYWWIPSGFILIGVTANIILGSMVILGIQLGKEHQKALREKDKRIKETEKRVREQNLRLSQEKAFKKQQEKEIKTLKKNILAQERLVFLGRLHAGFNHEIKNILFQIEAASNTSKILTDDLLEIVQVQEFDESEYREIVDLIISNIDIISTQVERCHNLRQQILPDNFALNHTSIHDLIDIGKLLDECIKLVFYSKSQALIKLEKEYQTDLYLIEANIPELNFVFISLLSNAWDAIQEQLNLKQQEEYIPSLKISIEDLSSHIQVIISDNGIAIPQNRESDIFHFFYTTKPPGKGTGLGLSLANDIIVARYQGNIELTQELGWKHFSVTLSKRQ